MEEISAGGVVFRRIDGRLDIQLIRDRYGKIAFPKGKMEQGETIEQTALREIEEETGIVGHIVAPLEQISYQYVSHKRGKIDKHVHYFLVEAQFGELQAQVEEIRDVAWISPEEAWREQRQSGYENNDSMLKKALNLLEMGEVTDGI